jgi:hypothetical protein
LPLATLNAWHLDSTPPTEFNPMIASFSRRALTAAIATAIAAGAAFAAPPATGNGTGSANPYATQIAELRATRALLEQADHDYKGHRAAAVKLITAAIHALHPPKPAAAQNRARAGTGTKPGTTQAAKKTGGNEPQAVSDNQLKQALASLTVIQGQLAAGSGNAATAAAAVQKAAQELQIALSIK